MDDWTRTPGAWVLGHRAYVRGAAAGSVVICTCGFESQVNPSLDSNCLVLVAHLQRAVRNGATVMGEDDGGAGVREPRRPLRPLGSADAALETG